jgi:four helix bundle protein
MRRIVKNFEDFDAWQQAMAVAEKVYRVSTQGRFAKDFVLRDQINGSAISIASNIAEGFERGSRAEFHHFLSIAKGSCGELRTQILLARRIGYLTDEAADSLLADAMIATRMIGKLRATVARQRRTPPVPRAPCPMPDEPCF